MPEGIDAARAAVLVLVAKRAPGATICPSEVARALTRTGGTVSHQAWGARLTFGRSC
ncbi:MAG: DUF3253 domain-containing protein [Sphingomonas sp.]|nr:MAG: DUF3253 domain-containing protein [Sphingomonas sp.]